MTETVEKGPSAAEYELGDRVRAYLELVRLPNLFTAAADVVMGFLFTHFRLTPDDQVLFGLLIGASCCLYAAGVTLNDVFDRDVDAKERPERPIPSGRVPLAAAKAIGWGLLALGVVLGGAATAMSGDMRPVAVAGGLAACIVLYDILLKRTPIGPVVMGACRALNVLLGMSLLDSAWTTPHWLIAGAIGSYVIGVTVFARGEAGRSKRWVLAAAAVFLLTGIGLLVPLPETVPPMALATILQLDPQRWYLLLGILAALTSWRCVQAIADPQSQRVQMTVGQLILTLVVLDAAACFVLRDVFGAAAVLLLLLPAVVLSRWIATT